MLTPPRGPGGAGQFDVVDALAVVGPYRDRPPGTPYTFEDLLDEHERFGIGERVVLHAESRDGVPDEGNENITRQTFLRDDTATIWTALPPRRFGGQPADRIIGDAQNAGVAMLAMFPDTHGHHLAPWANRELYAAMERVRLPLVLDIGNAQGSDARRRYDEVHAVATAHPGMPIILWNTFYMDERLQVPLLDLCRNVRIGIATVFIPTFGIEQYAARYGPDRLIFGSNWPRQSPGPLLTYVLYADVHARVKHAILGDTVRALAHDVRYKVHGIGRTTKAAGDAEPTDEAPTGQPADGTDDATPWLTAMADLKSGDFTGDEGEPTGRPLDPRRAAGEESE